ncbi:hypothetical protein V1511DRAFT_494747 [Dipodascopsis uninucleata]
MYLVLAHIAVIYIYIYTHAAQSSRSNNNSTGHITTYQHSPLYISPVADCKCSRVVPFYVNTGYYDIGLNDTMPKNGYAKTSNRSTSSKKKVV